MLREVTLFAAPLCALASYLLALSGFHTLPGVVASLTALAFAAMTGEEK